MQKLSKSEFMHRVINDKYNKKNNELEKLKGAEFHLMNNSAKIKEFNRRRSR